MDISDLIESFATNADGGGQLVVTRRARGTFVRGIATPGATSTLTITAVPRPVSGRDLQRLPEGRRTQETRVFDTTTELLAGDQDGAREADLVDIEGDGRPWEVQQVQRWPSAVLDRPAYTVTCQRPATG